MHEYPKVAFHPWVGSLYRGDNRFDLRLLVLGESHYEADGCSRLDFTTRVVKYNTTTKRHRFFTIIAKVLTDLDHRRGISNNERAAAWEHIAFYNFVQEALSGPRRAPTFRQWVEAQTPFQTVLQALKPDAVLVLGHRLDDHILVKPEQVSFGVIGHPSTGFAYEENIQRFRRLLEDAARRRTN